MRKTLIFLFSIAFFSSFAQTTSVKPKLIVGIVVDQMRYDYLYRYQARYGQNGFNRLLREGFSCEQTHYNYVPTFTAPGHAAIYTGTYPAVNGIIANEWYDPQWHRHRYVTTDTTVWPVPPNINKKTGQHSPRVLLSSTITDELRLSNNFQSKVVGVCLKDRASIIPAGHIPNACYWFDDKSGAFITSSYYQPKDTVLPKWVNDFNARKLPDNYIAQNWTKSQTGPYTESFENWGKYDDGKYSRNLTGGFPHDLTALKKTDGYGILRFTPWGNTLALEFAMAALDNMDLGTDDVPDFLCLSFSSTDYCAHQFGIHAEETEDVYLRLDQDLGRFLDYLDKKYGKNNVLVFLTADHGGGETPSHLNDLQIPAGVFDESKLEDNLEKLIASTFGITGNFILEASNQQVWLNWDALDGIDQDADQIEELIVDYLREQPGIYDAFSKEDLLLLPADYPFVSEIRRGINPHRSGDIIFQLDPAWHPDDQLFKLGGATHGSPYPYDTHVPLLWYGWKVKPGETFDPVSVTDIAPTLSAMLRIMEPNGCTGKVIPTVMPKKD
ncbi:MAG: alkaline phosphatase family protein [Bacteroidota bacterium]